MDKVYYDFSVSGVPTSGTQAFTAASASFAVPAATELLALSATASCHFRVGVGAQTAVAGDPMLVAGMSPVVVRLDPTHAYTLAVIQDSAGGNLNYAKVYMDAP